MFGRRHLIYRMKYRDECRARGNALVTPSSAMAHATMVAENRHMVLRRPLDALKIKNYRKFSPTELIDVQAAADILTHDIMPIVRTTRPSRMAGIL